jgi:hypothetical protein
MVVDMFVNEWAQLFFCHFSKEGVQRVGLRKIRVFFDLRDPFFLLGRQIATGFLYPEFR